MMRRSDAEGQQTASTIYPDSGKLGAIERLPQSGGLRAMFRLADTVDYRHGEQPSYHEMRDGQVWRWIDCPG